jgi:hypothetical protein
LITTHRQGAVVLGEEEMMVVDSKSKDTQVIQGNHIPTPPGLLHHLAMSLNNNTIITKQDLHR